MKTEALFNKCAPTHSIPRHTPLREEVHEAVRQFEQVTGFLQLHQKSHVDGQTSGVMGICLKNGGAESEGRVVFTVVIKPLQLRDPHIRVIPEHL